MSPSAEAKKTLSVLRLPAVRAKTQLPTSTIYAMMAAGRFPKPIALSANTRGWIEAEHFFRQESKRGTQATPGSQLATPRLV